MTVQELRPDDRNLMAMLVAGCDLATIGDALGMKELSIKSRIGVVCRRLDIEPTNRVLLAKAYLAAYPSKVKPTNNLHVLTKREHQIALVVATGKSNREAAEVLGTTENAMRQYLHRIFDKLGVWDRVELAVYVMRCNGVR